MIHLYCLFDRSSTFFHRRELQLACNFEDTIRLNHEIIVFIRETSGSSHESENLFLIITQTRAMTIVLNIKSFHCHGHWQLLD